MNLANNAQNLNFPGWKAFDNGRNRFAIINDYLEGAMSRSASCSTTTIARVSTRWRPTWSADAAT